MNGERCPNCKDGTVKVYNPAGYPPGTFPGNYVCPQCGTGFQIARETRAALSVAAERESDEALAAKIDVLTSWAHDLNVKIRQLENEIQRRQAESV